MTEAMLEALGAGTAAPDGAAEAADGSPGAACQAGQDAGCPETRRAEEASDQVLEDGEERAPGVPATGPAPDALRSHFDSLVAQGEALRAEFPDFDLAEALRDPAFLRLTAPALGVGVREPRRAAVLCSDS